MSRTSEDIIIEQDVEEMLSWIYTEDGSLSDIEQEVCRTLGNEGITPHQAIFAALANVNDSQNKIVL